MADSGTGAGGRGGGAVAGVAARVVVVTGARVVGGSDVGGTDVGGTDVAVEVEVVVGGVAGAAAVDGGDGSVVVAGVAVAPGRPGVAVGEAPSVVPSRRWSPSRTTADTASATAATAATTAAASLPRRRRGRRLAWARRGRGAPGGAASTTSSVVSKLDPPLERVLLRSCAFRAPRAMVGGAGGRSMGDRPVPGGRRRDGGRLGREALMPLFRDRVDAGRQLAERCDHLRGGGAVVVGLPRGGVPVASEVAQRLGAPLDVIVVRKLGVPFQPELGMGAVGEEGVRILNPEVIQAARLDGADVASVELRERAELERRAERFRGGRPRVALAGRTVLVVDDGIATGSTARAACQVARAHGATRVVLAVPVAPPGWTAGFVDDAEELVCVATPDRFAAIGQWYADFSQTTDEEVVACLDRAAARPPSPG